MAGVAFFCIFLGCFPQFLYQFLPNAVEYHPYTYDHIVSQLQLMFFTALGFFLLVRLGLLVLETPATNLDFDWFYRKGAHFFYAVMDWFLNGLNTLADRVLAKGFPGLLARMFRNFPGLISANFLSVGWAIFGLSDSEVQSRKAAVMTRFENGTVSVGFSAIAALLALCWLIGW